jgi:tetratricopeptide (TPR) repeat protein
VERHDLYNAKKHANALKRLSPDNSEVKLLNERIHTLIKMDVEKLTVQGNSLYRQERFAEAKSVWEKALRLDPENSALKANIERAARVLNKLQKAY